jgi:hypothetical protein
MIDVIAEAEGISLSSMQFKAMVGKGIIIIKDVCLHIKLNAGTVLKKLNAGSYLNWILPELNFLPFLLP